MRTLKLVTRFYSTIFLVNFLITMSCVYLMIHLGTGAFEIVGVLFWFKVCALAVIFYFSVTYNKNELYYYQNLGISTSFLAVTTSAFDFALWLALVWFQLRIGIPGYVFNLVLSGVLLVFLYLYYKNK